MEDVDDINCVNVCLLNTRDDIRSASLAAGKYTILHPTPTKPDRLGHYTTKVGGNHQPHHQHGHHDTQPVHGHTAIFLTAYLAYLEHSLAEIIPFLPSQPYSNGECHVHLIMMYHILRIHSSRTPQLTGYIPWHQDRYNWHSLFFTNINLHAYLLHNEI